MEVRVVSVVCVTVLEETISMEKLYLKEREGEHSFGKFIVLMSKRHRKR